MNALALALILIAILVAPHLVKRRGVTITVEDTRNPLTDGDPEMSKVTDAFAAYVAFRDQKEADAVAAAVQAEKDSHQGEVDTAVEAAEAADAAIIEAATPSALLNVS
jgi:hypothetical protein